MAAIALVSAIVAFTSESPLTTTLGPAIALSRNLSDLQEKLGFELGRDDALEPSVWIERCSHRLGACSSDGWMATKARRIIRKCTSTAESREVVAFEAAVTLVYCYKFLARIYDAM